MTMNAVPATVRTIQLAFFIYRPPVRPPPTSARPTTTHPRGRAQAGGDRERRTAPRRGAAVACPSCRDDARSSPGHGQRFETPQVEALAPAEAGFGDGQTKGGHAIEEPPESDLSFESSRRQQPAALSALIETLRLQGDARPCPSTR